MKQRTFESILDGDHFPTAIQKTNGFEAALPTPSGTLDSIDLDGMRAVSIEDNASKRREPLEHRKAD